MRRFGPNKRNPNPPWPNEAPVITPPGSGAKAIGMSEEKVKVMSEEELKVLNESVYGNSNNEREVRREPIMGNMLNGMQVQGNGKGQNEICGNMNVTSYLCGQKGKFVKIEFLFGENMHMEKSGILKGVGKDFVAIQEAGSDTIIVCAVNKIKFIHIYGYGK